MMCVGAAAVPYQSRLLFVFIRALVGEKTFTATYPNGVADGASKTNLIAGCTSHVRHSISLSFAMSLAPSFLLRLSLFPARLLAAYSHNSIHHADGTQTSSRRTWTNWFTRPTCPLNKWECYDLGLCRRDVGVGICAGVIEMIFSYARMPDDVIR